MKIVDQENGFEFTFNEGGDWIWKAIKPTPLAKKATTKEKPFFKVSEDIEKKYHQRFDAAILQGVKDVTRYLTKGVYDN